MKTLHELILEKIEARVKERYIYVGTNTQAQMEDAVESFATKLVDFFLDDEGFVRSNPVKDAL